MENLIALYDCNVSSLKESDIFADHGVLFVVLVKTPNEDSPADILAYRLEEEDLEYTTSKKVYYAALRSSLKLPDDQIHVRLVDFLNKNVTRVVFKDESKEL